MSLVRLQEATDFFFHALTLQEFGNSISELKLNNPRFLDLSSKAFMDSCGE